MSAVRGARTSGRAGIKEAGLMTPVCAEDTRPPLQPVQPHSLLQQTFYVIFIFFLVGVTAIQGEVFPSDELNRGLILRTYPSRQNYPFSHHAEHSH